MGLVLVLRDESRIANKVPNFRKAGEYFYESSDGVCMRVGASEDVILMDAGLKG